jgi:DNA-binding response OmpR family regulator
MAMRVLVVDDELSNRELLAAILRRDGYQVTLADSGEHALAAIAADPPDLVLLDLVMPGIGGLEVCRCLRADPQTRTMPILVVSAVEDLASKEAALTEGVGDYVPKPVEAADLRVRVRALLAVRHIREEPARTLAYLRALDSTPGLGSPQEGYSSPPVHAELGWTRVLLVDDDQLHRELYGTLLREQGFTVHLADSGEAALERLANGSYEVVVTDIVMPGMSGLVVLERARGQAPDLPVIILTAHPTSQHALAALKLGAFDFLVKGPDQSLIALAVHRAVRHHRAAVASRAEVQYLRSRIAQLEIALQRVGGSQTTGVAR